MKITSALGVFGVALIVGGVVCRPVQLLGVAIIAAAALASEMATLG